MTMRRLYTALIFVSLFTHGEAFRRNVANIAKHDHATMYEAAPPDVQGMMHETTLIINAKIAAAVARLAEAQESLMKLSMATAGSNNSNKGMSAHEAVDAMMAANREKATAIAVKSTVELMVEACTTLFAAVESFKTNSEPRAALQREETKKIMEQKIEGYKMATVDTERIDLGKLLDLIQKIIDAEALVKTLDEKVGAGAAPGIVGATKLVHLYAKQLKDRQTSVTTADALARMPPLQPKDAKLRIEPQFAASLEAASAAIDSIIKAKQQLVDDANAQLMIVAGSVKQSNATKMHKIIDNLMAANQAKADAVALAAAIDTAMQVIKEFFRAFAGYRSAEAQKKEIASAHVDTIIANAGEKHKATDARVLMEVGSFFHLYQMMWARAMEADAAIPEGDDDYAGIHNALNFYSVEIHKWLNNELATLCTYYTTCTAARAALIALLQTKSTWCGERFTKLFCINGAEKDDKETEQFDGGEQPNGKMCKWTPPDNAKALEGTCAAVHPPTDDLQFGKNHPDGLGIFY